MARDLGLGRVDHDWYGRLGRQATHEFIHVAHAVRTGVVHTDVQDVCTLFDLLASYRDTRIPVARQHCFSKQLRAVRVGTFAHQEHRAILVVGGGRVDRGNGRIELGGALGGVKWANRLHNLIEVRGRRAATATHNLDAVLGDELRQMFRERLGRQVVVHLSLDDTG